MNLEDAKKLLRDAEFRRQAEAELNGNIDNLLLEVLKTGAYRDRLESISEMLNLSEEDRNSLLCYRLHFRDEKPFNESAINDPQFRKELEIDGVPEKLFRDLNYRAHIASIYELLLRKQ